MLLCKFGAWELKSNEEKTFFYFGTEKDMLSVWGVPVNQCGTTSKKLLFEGYS